MVTITRIKQKIMKKIKFIVPILSVFILIGCENPLKEDVLFNVTPKVDGKTVASETVNVSAGTPVIFNFSGNADFITFYSGETGHEYAKKDLFQIPMEQVSSSLEFDVKPQYGIIPNTLSVYLSTTMQGLLGNNKATDSVTIENEKWINITEQVNLPTKSNQKVSVSVPLNEYLGKKLTLAFHYKTDQNSATQPTWLLLNLRIKNALNSGEISEIPPTSMGFSAFDMLTDTPYKNSGGSGIWNLTVRKINKEIRMQSSPSGAPLNDDWLISNPILINSRAGDTGVVIKKMSIDMDSYKYVFNKAGTYTVTFVARNANYKSTSELIKTVQVVVSE